MPAPAAATRAMSDCGAPAGRCGDRPRTRGSRGSRGSGCHGRHRPGISTRGADHRRVGGVVPATAEARVEHRPGRVVGPIHRHGTPELETVRTVNRAAAGDVGPQAVIGVVAPGPEGSAVDIGAGIHLPTGRACTVCGRDIRHRHHFAAPAAPVVEAVGAVGVELLSDRQRAGEYASSYHRRP